MHIVKNAQLQKQNTSTCTCFVLTSYFITFMMLIFKLHIVLYLGLGQDSIKQVISPT